MTDPKPFVIPPDLPADVMQYERGWNACLEALAASHREPSAQPADKPAGQAVTDERKEAESAYSMSAFDYPANPIGSRDWCIYWDGWKARAAHAPEPATAAADALRWIMRFADKCKKPCGDDPESPTAIRNAHFATVGAAAAQGLGLVRGPSLAVPAAAVPDDLLDLIERHVSEWNDCRSPQIAQNAMFAISGWIRNYPEEWEGAAPNRPADAQRGVPVCWNGDDVEKAVHVLTILHNDSATECDKDGRAELAAVHRDAVSLLEYTLELHREHQSILAASPADPLPALEVSP